MEECSVYAQHHQLNEADVMVNLCWQSKNDLWVSYCIYLYVLWIHNVSFNDFLCLFFWRYDSFKCQNLKTQYCLRLGWQNTQMDVQTRFIFLYLILNEKYCWNDICGRFGTSWISFGLLRTVNRGITISIERKCISIYNRKWHKILTNFLKNNHPF